MIVGRMRDSVKVGVSLRGVGGGCPSQDEGGCVPLSWGGEVHQAR